MSSFDFVGVTEQYDASMFLLYHQFQWPQILYTVVNKGVYSPPELGEEAATKFRELNADDHRTYEEALAIFEQKIEGYGSNFDNYCFG